MAKYLLYKPLKNLAKILSFGQNIDISLGGYFFTHPVDMRIVYAFGDCNR